MFIASPRISVFIEPLDSWVLVVEDVQKSDQGLYECHLNSKSKEESIKMITQLSVRGQWNSQKHFSFELWLSVAMV